MKKIIYSDKINRKKIEIEVSEEVESFLDKSNKEIVNSNRDWRRHIISLDAIMDYIEKSENGQCKFDELIQDDNYFMDEDVRETIIEYHQKELGTFLQNLPWDLAAIYKLRFQKKLKGREIAEKLHMPRTTINYKIKVLKKKLSQMIFNDEI